MAVIEQAADGHLKAYRVVGVRLDGSVRLSQWDAVCVAACLVCAGGDR